MDKKGYNLVARSNQHFVYKMHQNQTSIAVHLSVSAFQIIVQCKLTVPFISSGAQLVLLNFTLFYILFITEANKYFILAVCACQTNMGSGWNVSGRNILIPHTLIVHSTLEGVDPAN